MTTRNEPPDHDRTDMTDTDADDRPRDRTGARALGRREQPASGAGQHTREDRCRLRTGHAARNRAALRRIALNFLTLMQQYFRPRMSIHRLRKMVARNPAQLEPIMTL